MTKNFYNKIYPKKAINRIYTKCRMLGDNSNINYISFMNIRILSTILIFFILLFFTNRGYILAPLIAIIVYLSFEYILDYLLKKRANKLNYQAIFYFQVLSIVLQTGRNLRSAIELTSNNIDNEISKEFKIALKEVDLGKSLVDALKSMKERIPSQEINTVLLNIIQSSIFGNNIVDSLNNQIEYLRDKKILNIKSKINKMPLKVSIVSVIFIVPLILLLLLAPVVINFMISR